jgi:uncharacterized heparinase superfamily protein
MSRFPTPDDGENNAAYWRKRAKELESWISRADEAESAVARVQALVKDWRKYHHPRQGAFSGAVIECAQDVENALGGPL